MELNLLDVVTSNVTLPDFGVTAGMAGTIVEVYGDGEFEVEFCDDDGYTFALLTMQAAQITLTWKYTESAE